MSNQLSSNKPTRLYHSYLVRLWQDDQQTTWRVVAQSVQSGETTHFADLASLFVFLQAQTTSEQTEDGEGQVESSQWDSNQ